jgi:hypothetical protein
MSYVSDPITNFANWYFQHGYPGNPFVVLGVFAVVMLVAAVGLWLGVARYRSVR